MLSSLDIFPLPKKSFLKGGERKEEKKLKGSSKRGGAKKIIFPPSLFSNLYQEKFQWRLPKLQRQDISSFPILFHPTFLFFPNRRGLVLVMRTSYVRLDIEEVLHVSSSPKWTRLALIVFGQPLVPSF